MTTSGVVWRDASGRAVESLPAGRGNSSQGPFSSSGLQGSEDGGSVG
jgi:hypothetical protein